MANLTHISNTDYFLMQDMLFNIAAILTLYFWAIYTLFYWTYSYSEFVGYLFEYFVTMLLFILLFS